MATKEPWKVCRIARPPSLRDSDRADGAIAATVACPPTRIKTRSASGESRGSLLGGNGFVRALRPVHGRDHVVVRLAGPHVRVHVCRPGLGRRGKARVAPA